MTQRIYVSYAADDRLAADYLVAALSPDATLQAWAPPTRSTDAATTEGLRLSLTAADAVVLVVTANALVSTLCEIEVEAAVKAGVPVVAAIAGDLSKLSPPSWLGDFPIADFRVGDTAELVEILRTLQPAMAGASVSSPQAAPPPPPSPSPPEDFDRPLTSEDLNRFIPVEVVATPEPQGAVGSTYQQYRTNFEPNAQPAVEAAAPGAVPWGRARPEPRFVATASAKSKIHAACTWLFVIGFLNFLVGVLVVALVDRPEVMPAAWASIGVGAVYFVAAILGARGSEVLFNILFGLIVIDIAATFVLNGIGAGLAGLLIKGFFARAMRRGAQGAAELKLAAANPAFTHV